MSKNRTERVCILHQGYTIKSQVLAGFMKKYGNLSMVKYLRDFVYTIRMVTPSITNWSILNYLKGQNIKGNTIRKDLKTRRQGKKTLNNCVNLLRQESPTFGLGQKKDGNIVDEIPNTYVQRNESRISLVQSALRRIKHGILGITDIAPKNVGESPTELGTPITFVSTKDAGNDDVYNLFVEGQHEYFANGILVSNCLATSYWRVGMDRYGVPQGSIHLPPMGNTVKVAPVIDEVDGTHKDGIKMRDGKFVWGDEVDINDLS